MKRKPDVYFVIAVITKSVDVIARSMTGIEYELLHAMEPILYVIRKQNRHSPTQGLQRVINESLIFNTVSLVQ